MFFVRQNATHKIVIGPAVAVGDGFTPITTLSVSTADEAEVILHDNGTVVSISGYTFAAITTADGYYHLTLQSGISGTVGHVTVVINDDSLCLPVKAEFTVVEEAIYDAFYAASATGLMPANVTQFGGQTGTFAAGFPEVNAAYVAGQTVSAAGAVTFPSTIASTTNITGGTITTVTTLTGHTAQTGDSFARIGATGSGLTSLATQASLNEVIAEMEGQFIARGAIGSTGNSTTTLHLTGLTFGDDELSGRIIVVADDDQGEKHAVWITGWVLSTALATVETLPFTPQNGVDTYWVLPVRRDGTVSDKTGFALSSTGMDAVTLPANILTASALAADAGTEIGTAVWATTTRRVSDATNITSTGGTTFTQTGDTYALANGATGFAAIDTVVDAILVDTAEIGVAGAGLTEAGATGDHLTAVPWNAAWDAEVQSECADALTAYDPPTQTEILAAHTTTDALIAGLNDPTSAAIATAVLTTAMTESYAADGATMTVAQALYLILANAAEFAIAGTTLTAKKLDGSTTAATYTLDDATNPTSRTRAT